MHEAMVSDEMGVYVGITRLHESETFVTLE